MSRKVDFFLFVEKPAKNKDESSKTVDFPGWCNMYPAEVQHGNLKMMAFRKESPFPGADFQIPCLTSGV